MEGSGFRVEGFGNVPPPHFEQGGAPQLCSSSHHSSSTHRTPCVHTPHQVEIFTRYENVNTENSCRRQGGVRRSCPLHSDFSSQNLQLSNPGLETPSLKSIFPNGKPLRKPLRLGVCLLRQGGAEGGVRRSSGPPQGRCSPLRPDL